MALLFLHQARNADTPDGRSDRRERRCRRVIFVGGTIAKILIRQIRRYLWEPETELAIASPVFDCCWSGLRVPNAHISR